MKESKILKIICYIIMPILILTLAMSIFSIILEESGEYDEEKYFSSESFVGSYMGALSNTISDFIHNNDMYYSLQDGEIEIHYSPGNLNYYVGAQDAYFLIIYKNKALTNVELIDSTNSIEKIKTYINKNEESKHVNIIYGNIDTDKEIMKIKAYKYLHQLVEPYYTLQEATDTTSQYIEYITAYPEDFEIYSSYKEEFKQNTQVEAVSNFLNIIEPYQKYNYFIIPISLALIIMIIVYLITSIGYKKGIKGIALNDFDKIPLEIIIVIATILGCIPFILLYSINENYNAFFSLMVTNFLVIYVLCTILLVTIIKRIKAKTLLKTSITGKTLILLANCLEIIARKIQNVWNTLTYSTVTVKLIAYMIVMASISIFIFFAFNNSPELIVIFELMLVGIILYKIIKGAKNYDKIERQLKEMYEGNNKNKLDIDEFSNEFKNSVKYINDISNGVENAIQDRIKSERLKAELITNVSHDIKTPLTSIINYVDLLKQENIQNQKAKEYIEILDNKSQRLKKLTEDLVEASKVSTGNIALNLEKINIVELIKQAVGEFEDKFEKRGLNTIINCEENEINIMADSRYMYRIIENLFSNISKYALDNSRVYVDIMANLANWDQVPNYPNNHVIIEIKNISKEKLNITAEELMQRFVRGDRSRTTDGSGLGISIAQNLTELQNGKFNLILDGDLFKVELKFEMAN